MAGYLDHYLKQLDPILGDPLTIELAINGDAGIWVEKAGAAHMRRFEGIRLSPDDVTDLAKQITNKNQLTLTPSSPMISIERCRNSERSLSSPRMSANIDSVCMRTSVGLDGSTWPFTREMVSSPVALL